MAARRDPCARCGDNPAFKKRNGWRLLRLTGRNQQSGASIDEGLVLLCELCMVRVRAAMTKPELEPI